MGVQMKKKWILVAIIPLCGFGLLAPGAGNILAADPKPADAKAFPRSLESYEHDEAESIWAILKNRVNQEPFNLVATLIFFLAIVHTFLTGRFMTISHQWEHAHAKKIERGEAGRDSVHHGAELFHFLGEVEAVFGIWAIALGVAIIGFYDWKTAVNYLSHRVNFTEALFVVVVMTLASTRPILKVSEAIMWRIANLLRGTLTAWWFTILTVGPVLGSLITEPAAMTISALLLAEKFYELEPSTKFKYATIGLLFVNISVGGTLSNFAAPPVLMVASPWNWDMAFMIVNFGWKAIIGILISNGLYFLMFRREMANLEQKFTFVKLKDDIQHNYLRRKDMDVRFDKLLRAVDDELGTRELVDQQVIKVEERVRQMLKDQLLPKLSEQGVDKKMIKQAFEERFEEIKLREMRRALPGLLPPEQRGPFVDPDWDKRDDPVPAWVTAIHVFFMAWTIVNAHYPALFIPGLLFFLGFAQVTSQFQNRVDLKPALLVGFFLGGLVIHGGVQGWWIAPVLGNLAEVPLMLGATVLTAFNDNAAITFLSTLVPNFTDPLKYAVVAGAVAGGGLTVIANAPNPAGLSILKKYFGNEVSPAGIAKFALLPTVIMLILFIVIR
jgi:hypothetical protein